MKFPLRRVPFDLRLRIITSNRASGSSSVTESVCRIQDAKLCSRTAPTYFFPLFSRPPRRLHPLITIDTTRVHRATERSGLRRQESIDLANLDSPSKPRSDACQQRGRVGDDKTARVRRRCGVVVPNRQTKHDFMFRSFMSLATTIQRKRLWKTPLVRTSNKPSRRRVDVT